MATEARSTTTLRVPVPDAVLAVAIRGSGPLVVLAPGCGRPATDLDPLADALAAAGYRAASVDYRGAGESTGRYVDPTLHAIAADFAAVIEALGGNPAILVGHAFGNRVVRCLAADAPHLVERLVLLAAGGKIPPACDPRAVWFHILTSPPSLPARAEAIADAFFAPGHDPAAWRDWEASCIPALFEAAGFTPLDDWWTGGQAPMLVVQGALDRTAPPANAAALARDAAGRVARVDIAGAGHALLPERPRAVIDAVLGWLADPQVAPAPPRIRDRGLWAIGSFIESLAERTAEENAGFLLPHIRPGDRVLDCGCGPGSITRGLAAAAAPGVVVGLDLDPAILGRARQAAQGEPGALRWVRAGVEALPFADASFDVVFAHTLLMHVDDPAAVLGEFRRVLRPGGRIGLVDADWGTEVVHPTLPMLTSVLEAGFEASRAMGMEPCFGRRHRGLLTAAGFEGIEVSLHRRISADPASVASEARGRIDALDFALKRGQLDPMSHQLATTGWRRWAASPDAMHFRGRFESTAIKP